MEKNFVINRQLLGWFFSHDKWLRQLLLGALIMIVPIVNMFIGYGYWMQVLQNSMKKEEVLPDWTGWKEKFFLSIQGLVLSFTYMFLSFLVFAGIGLVILLPISLLSEDAAYIGLGVLYFAYCIIFSFIIMIAIAHFVYNDSLGAGFNVKAVLTITWRSILKMILLGLAMFACNIGPIILIFIVFVLLSAVFPLAGNTTAIVFYLMLFPVIFWSNVTYQYGLGKIYLDAVDDPPAAHTGSEGIIPSLLE